MKLLSPTGAVTSLAQSNITNFRNGIGVFGYEENNRFGLIDSSGKVLTPAIFDGIQALRNHLFIVQKDQRYGLVGVNGKEILPPSLQSIGEFKFNFATATLDGTHFGLINTSGQWVVKPTIDAEIHILSDRLFSYTTQNKTTYKNLQGKTLAEVDGYSTFQSVGNGLGILHLENSETGEEQTKLIAVETGQDVLTAEQLPGDPKAYFFDVLYNDSSDTYTEDGSKGIAIRISKRGAEDVESVGLYIPALKKFYPPIWKEISSGERDGFLTVKMDDSSSDQTYLLNTTSGEISQRGAYFISAYENKRNSKFVISYAYDHKYGVMDLSGKWIIQPQFEKVMIGEGDQLFSVQTAYNQWQILDATGKPAWPETFEDVSRPDGDTLFARKNKQLLLLKAGQAPKLLDNNLYLLSTQFGERGSVPIQNRSTGKIALLDRSGEWLTQPIFDRLEKGENSTFYRSSKTVNGEYVEGLVDSKGKDIIPAKFNRLSNFQDRFYIGCTNTACQLFDRKGQEINTAIRFNENDSPRLINDTPPKDSNIPTWLEIQTNTGTWFVNSNGKSLRLDDVFEGANLLEDQTLVLQTKQTQALFDDKGKQLTPWGDQVDDFGELIMWQANGKHQVYDGNGQLNEALSKQGKYIDWVGEGRIQENGSNGNYVLTSLTGERYPLPAGYFIYSDAYKAKFVDGLAPVTSAHDDNGLSGYVKPNGQFAFKTKYRYVDNYAEGLALVVDAKSQQYGFIDKSGKTAVPFNYTVANTFSEGIASTVEKQRDDISLIDTKGTTQFRVSARCGNNVLTDAAGKVTWQGRPCVTFIESKMPN